MPSSDRTDHFFRLAVWRYPFVVLGLAVCAGSLCGQAPPVATEELTGAIRGTVTYVADPQHPWRLGRYYIGNILKGELAEAVVAISSRRLRAPNHDRKPFTATIDQKNFQFIPETVAIRAGDRVRFLNSDNQTHNVRTSNPRHSFNVTMPVGGEHTETFKSASGIGQPYRIDCVFHSAMRAWVFVFDHRWFSVTGKDGSFRLENVPAGDYRLDVVHPAGNLRTSETVHVVAGKVSQVDIRLPASKAKL